MTAITDPAPARFGAGGRETASARTGAVAGAGTHVVAGGGASEAGRAGSPEAADGSAGEAGREGASRSVLVIGFGNTLRRDDGVGAVAAERLAEDRRTTGLEVEVKEAYQLLPEMALDIAEHSLVVFMDADMRALPGAIEVRPLEPDARVVDADTRPAPGTSSHHVGGVELVALAERLTGRRPDAIAVGIGVNDLDVGEGLSAVVEDALPRLVDVIVAIVEEHLRPPR